MATYRKKPIKIEAYRHDGLEPLPLWIKTALISGTIYFVSNKMHIKTLEGNIYVSVGDYIVQDENWKLYPCKPDIFEKTYDCVDEKQEIRVEYECNSCEGTGLYIGTCEYNGAATVCRDCSGTGKRVFTAKPFTGLKVADGVKRVFDYSHGYVLSSKDETDDGEVIPFSQWGCTYEEWLDGAVPVPLKGLICPNHQVGSSPLGDKCDKGCGGWGGTISKCRHYADKATCWEEYDDWRWCGRTDYGTVDGRQV